MPRDTQIVLPRGLILSSTETEYRMGLNDAFVNSLNEQLQGAGRLEWRNYQQIGMEFATNRARAFLSSSGLDLKAFKLVYFKSYFRYHEQAAAIAECLDAQGVRFLCGELRRYVPLTKLTQLARLARAGLPIARTIYMPANDFKKSYQWLREVLGIPFVFKAIDASEGRNNYLIKDKQQLYDVLQRSPELQFIAQEFIPNSSDLRILVVNKRIELIIKRQRRDDSTHLNNTSQGAGVSLVPIEELAAAAQKLALKAAALMRRETAGVDLMFSSASGKPYILEVNTSPQIASGAFTDEKLKMYSKFFRNMLK